MLLHIGGDTVVRTGDIIGIFDMDTSTVGKATRDFLTRAEQQKPGAVCKLRPAQKLCAYQRDGVYQSPECKHADQTMEITHFR